MGDTVNLAARLVARAQPGGLLATGDVLERSATQFETEGQPLLVKGKERAVTAYSVGRVTGRREEQAAQQVLPIVGRDAELAQLNEAINAARMRQGRLVELVGEPGIGKSRLVEELKTLRRRLQPARRRSASATRRRSRSTRSASTCARSPGSCPGSPPRRRAPICRGSSRR